MRKQQHLMKILKYELSLVNANPDLVIAIGGDGTFIQAIIENKFRVERVCLEDIRVFTKDSMIK